MRKRLILAAVCAAIPASHLAAGTIEVPPGSTLLWPNGGTIQTPDVPPPPPPPVPDPEPPPVVVVPPPPVPPAPPPTQACLQGDPIPKSTALVFAPTMPQPAASDDLVGVILQNTDVAVDGPSYVTFGQMFTQGKLASTDGLQVKAEGNSYQAQMDPLSVWPDGSIKFASVTVPSNVCRGTQLPAMLVKSAAPGVPVDFAKNPVPLSVDLAFTAGGTSQKIDLGAALQASLAGGPDLWLNGPLVVQARVDVPVPGTSTLHITADVTIYADGSAAADVQFNNDLTKVRASNNNAPPALPALVYTATITLGDQKKIFPIAQQYQYQDWHATVASAPGAAINVQHDAAQLQATGAVLPYDLKMGYNSSRLDTLTKTPWVGYSEPFGTAKNPAVGAPLSANGVSQHMPTTGGRPDIAWTHMYAVIWVTTQDARAANVVRLWGDTAGAVPWNFKLASGQIGADRWLTPADHPNFWADPRSIGEGLLNKVADVETNWYADIQHAPDLAYPAYLMTGSRWYYDRLNALAAWHLSDRWQSYRCDPSMKCTPPNMVDLAMDLRSTVRGQAWSMRTLMEAGWLGKPGSWEQKYFDDVARRNWDFVLRNTRDDVGGGKPGLISVAAEGDPAGYLPQYAYPIQNSPNLGISLFMNDYVSGVGVWGAIMGYDGAKQFVGWQKDHWLTGRILGTGMNSYDACTYVLVAWDGTAKKPLKSWAEIEAATVAGGESHGQASLTSDYCNWYTGVLGGALHVFPGDQKLQAARDWVISHADPKLGVVNKSSQFQIDPSWNVVPPQ